MGGDGFVLPPQPYVPGRTARHPDDLFEPLKSDLHHGMTPESLAQSAAWRAGWACFNAGYYWEAHELFEPVWMVLPPNSAERHLVQAAIQLANAALKARMGRPRAVARICDLAAGHLARVGGDGESRMGLDPRQLERALEALRRGDAVSEEIAHYNA